ncbi:MAG: tail assembly chaperone [Oscillospiraceae bacterium]|nr:MAG TPA: tail assembly chaperone [Caudoviricetes sp.]DAT22944.1 MAG TPA: tail assembly chaperone [Caudoviricetes sp.]
MLELTINDKVYEFHFGFGFLKEINKRVVMPLEGAKDVKKNVGLQFAVASVIDGDVEQLADVLDAANKGCVPRVARKDLEQYIESTDDIDALFKSVLDFLKTSNCCKKVTLEFLALVEAKRTEDPER